MDKQFVQETVQKNKRRVVYARLKISKLPYISKCQLHGCFEDCHNIISIK